MTTDDMLNALHRYLTVRLPDHLVRDLLDQIERALLAGNGPELERLLGELAGHGIVLPEGLLNRLRGACTTTRLAALADQPRNSSGGPGEGPDY